MPTSSSCGLSSASPECDRSSGARAAPARASGGAPGRCRTCPMAGRRRGAAHGPAGIAAHHVVEMRRARAPVAEDEDRRRQIAPWPAAWARWPAPRAPTRASGPAQRPRSSRSRPAGRAGHPRGRPARGCQIRAFEWMRHAARCPMRLRRQLSFGNRKRNQPLAPASRFAPLVASRALSAALDPGGGALTAWRKGPRRV